MARGEVTLEVILIIAVALICIAVIGWALLNHAYLYAPEAVPGINRTLDATKTAVTLP